MNIEMMKKVICFAIMSLYVGNVFACSFMVSKGFQPTLKNWERHPGPAQQGGSGDYWEKIPKPVIEVKEITRGYAKQEQSCDGDICEITYDSCNDAGTLSMEASLPKSSTYQVKEFGVYLRIKSGEQPDEIFPESPVYSRIENGKMALFFAWLDQPKSQQKPLNLTVEAFFVANDLSIGPSMTFKIEQK